MKIPYTAVIGGPEERYRMVAYDVVGEPKPCCEQMEDEWGTLIVLYCFGYDRPENLAAGLVTTFIQADDHVITGMLEINYCPFCGEQLLPVPADEAGGRASGGDVADATL